MKNQPTSFREWLKQMCEKEHLSLRQAAQRTGLSHASIRDLMSGTKPTPETIRKLARAFAGDGTHERLALEDHLLVLAGYRTSRPEEELSQPLAQLIDRLSEFSEPQVRIMGRFADFLAELENERWNHQNR